MAGSAEDVKARADQLIEKEQWSEVHALLTDEERNPYLKTDPELSWRAAWSCHEMANINAENSDKRKPFTFEGFDHAQRGLKADPEHGFCNLWYGIFLDLTSAYEGGVKKRISNAKAVKKHFEQALLKNPKDALTLHSMGVWHFECADLDLDELADEEIEPPPKSTYQDALCFLQQAEEATPNFYSCNLLYLGKCHQRMGHVEDARTFYARCMDYRSNSLEDQEAKEEARTLLASL